MDNEKPQIAVFSLAFYPFEGGAEVACREIIKRLPRLNFAIFTYKFDMKWPSVEADGNAEIIRLGLGSNGKKYGRILDKALYIFRALRAAEKAHKEKKFKVIWAIMASYGGIAALFFKLRHPEISLLLTVQEGDSEKYLVSGRMGLVGFFGKKIFQKADFIQAISNYLKDFAIKRGARCPIEVVPNGVDIKNFSKKYSELEIKELRDRLGLKDEYIIVTTSRLVYKNGVDVLIDAIAKFREKTPNVKCLVVGDGPERSNLESKIKKLGIERNILLLGQIDQKEIPLYLKISDIFARPSRSEGLGNSFLEAMAAGIPVIGTPVGGIVDFLVDKETGFIMQVDDSKELADKIDFIIQNPELCKKIANNGLKMVKDRYSWDKIAESFSDIFNNKLIK
ncbi:MAG: glycosyltransferase family 4 protein [Candidatus Pacebacteria bacterium]|nr:glycosyltransferase family 4 protein [Candidatus Paceibacterota bacterium]